MIKFYNSQWFGINFEDILKLSRRHIAGQDFYERFYKEFFDKHQSFDDLDNDWKEEKERVGDFLCSQLPTGKLLSVGAGLGYIECYINRNFSDKVEVHVSDFSDASNKWLRKELPEERIHKENFGNDYDLIYICNVDYALTNSEFVEMLLELSPALNSSGEFVILTHILKGDLWYSGLRRAKDLVKHCLEIFQLKRKSQFWGYLRTENDFMLMFNDADMYLCDSGYLDKKTFFFKVKQKI